MTTLQNLKVVIFDWDNTLAETRTCLVKSIDTVLFNHNLPSWNEIKHKRDANLSFRDNFSVLYGADAQAFYEEYKAVYKENMQNLLTAYPFGLEVIKFFRKNNIQVILMTNKDRELLDIEMPFLYSPKLFDKIVCGREALKDKPFPEHAYYALDGIFTPDEINTKNVWIIGDSKQDSGCAIACGALPIIIGSDIWGDDVKLEKNIVYYNNFEELYISLEGSSDE